MDIFEVDISIIDDMFNIDDLDLECFDIDFSELDKMLEQIEI